MNLETRLILYESYINLFQVWKKSQLNINVSKLTITFGTHILLEIVKLKEEAKILSLCFILTSINKIGSHSRLRIELVHLNSFILRTKYGPSSNFSFWTTRKSVQIQQCMTSKSEGFKADLMVRKRFNRSFLGSTWLKVLNQSLFKLKMRLKMVKCLNVPERGQNVAFYGREI